MCARIWKGSEVDTGDYARQPSYYFTKGNRQASCGESSLVNWVILKLKGYMVKEIGGKVYEWRTDDPNDMIGHGRNEAVIDGEIKVVDYNFVYPRDWFYENTERIITTPDYDDDWYKK
ncbi:MAG: hypothetical protein P8X91_03320 [Candidatus Bathyarchaeota archaeon]